MKGAALVVLVVLAGCQASGDDGFKPIGSGPSPPGGDGSGTPPGDGGVVDSSTGDGGAGGVTLTGRVCLLTDLRQIGQLAKCASTGVGGLTVSFGVGPASTAGTRTTTTAANGAFTLNAQLGSGYLWHVTGPITGANAIRPSVMRFGTTNVIPVMVKATYDALAEGNQIPFGDTDGSLVVHTVRRAAVVTGVVASSAVSTNPTLYDTANANVWVESDGTGAFGISWLAGINTPVVGGVATVSLQDGAKLTSVSLPVEDSSITYEIVDLPPAQ
jgi:hypothetical protein